MEGGVDSLSWREMTRLGGVPRCPLCRPRPGAAELT